MGSGDLSQCVASYVAACGRPVASRELAAVLHVPQAAAQSALRGAAFVKAVRWTYDGWVSVSPGRPGRVEATLPPVFTSGTAPLPTPPCVWLPFHRDLSSPVDMWPSIANGDRVVLMTLQEPWRHVTVVGVAWIVEGNPCDIEVKLAGGSPFLEEAAYAPTRGWTTALRYTPLLRAPNMCHAQVACLHGPARLRLWALGILEHDSGYDYDLQPAWRPAWHPATDALANLREAIHCDPALARSPAVRQRVVELCAESQRERTAEADAATATAAGEARHAARWEPFHAFTRFWGRRMELPNEASSAHVD